jgi:hypothetical protein
VPRVTSRFVSNEAYLTAADAVRASADYKTKLADAIANGADKFKLTISFESAFGKNYKVVHEK